MNLPTPADYLNNQPMIAWDIVTGQKVISAGRRNDADSNGHTGAVLSMCHHDESGLLVSTGVDRTIRFWDPRSNCISRGSIDTLRGHTDKVTAVNDEGKCQHPTEWAGNADTRSGARK